jgi:uncharacterized repeat protein (TIGR03943 family)
MSRQAQAVVMLLFGGAVLKASLTDMYLRYVKEVLQPFLVVASVLLIVAGVMTLWYEFRASLSGRAAGTDPAVDPGGHDHGSGPHREPRVGWLLIAPVLGLLLVAPPALGSYTASTSGTTAGQGSGFTSLPEVSLVELTMLDYAARAIWDDGTSLEGRRVRLTGFLLTGPDGEPHLARLVLSCCAADARPVKVGLAGDAPAGLADDTWLEVIGTYTDQTGIDPINEATIAFLHVETWREIEAPANPYE